MATKKTTQSNTATKLTKLIRPGVKVALNTGKDKGKEFIVISVNRDSMRVALEGFGEIQDYNNPLKKGEKVFKPKTVNISNLKFVAAATAEVKESKTKEEGTSKVKAKKETKTSKSTKNSK